MTLPDNSLPNGNQTCACPACGSEVSALDVYNKADAGSVVLVLGIFEALHVLDGAYDEVNERLCEAEDVLLPSYSVPGSELDIAQQAVLRSVTTLRELLVELLLIRKVPN